MMTLMTPLLLYLSLIPDTVLCYQTPDYCPVHHQVNILNSLPSCQVQIVPDHVTVPRCSGSCYVPTHTCLAEVQGIKVVQVMLVMSRWPHGEHKTVCTEVEVEVHHECGCGCKFQPEQCLPYLQYYHPPSCRCMCTAPADSTSCTGTGKVWDQATCQCTCPQHSYQQCSTGYMFDYVSTCSCVLIYSTASKSIIAGIFTLCVLICIMVFGGCCMPSIKGRIFKNKTTFTKSVQQPIKRKYFMSQASKIEYEMMGRNLRTDKLLTIEEFDKRRKSVKQ